ncbi:MAG: primosomal protein N' [Candidatus Eisenbacteria bacterium]
MKEVLKAEVAVPLPIDTTLTYLVPEEFKDTIQVGMRVTIPVRRKVVTGMVWRLYRDAGTRRGLKAIRQITDDSPVLNQELMELAAWISDYYVAPVGEVAAVMSPPQPKLKRVYRISGYPGDLELEIMKATHPERAEIIEILKDGKPLGIDTIKRRVGSGHVAEHLEALEKDGQVVHEVVARKRRIPRQSADDIGTYAGRDASDDRFELTPDQQAAFDGIRSAIDAKQSRNFLLLGVTGSGKTEVYLRCIDQALKSGRKAIYLVPEIALTPQIMERVRARFGERSALLHSGLSNAQRFATWRSIMAGSIDVVVGARSAVFAPFQDLGVIVVDEEHDTSYKQQDSPRYNARDVAMVRARRAGAVVILGSATPALETYHNALSGKYGFFELPERISGGELPEVSVVDMRLCEDPAPISKEAEAAIADSIERSEQVLLFLNRRGFSNYVQCRDCGLVPRCRNCHVSLTYHLGGKQLKCHYCGYTERGWDQCPGCGGTHVEYVGSGTQKIEDYIAERFPGTSCARFDRDATRKKGSAEDLLTDFSSGLVRFLVGTQMVAKGHDFRRVGLVVVVCADVSMNLPDFRSGERTFQILTQVAGRAGRGDIPGKVIVQTFNPDHHSLSHVANHDFKGFYGEEIIFREELRYPPFAGLVRVVVEARQEASARGAAKQFAGLAMHHSGNLKGTLDVIGPSRAPISRIRNVYRWHLILKGERTSRLSQFARSCLSELRSKALDEGARFAIDVDPQVMM